MTTNRPNAGLIQTELQRFTLKIFFATHIKKANPSEEIFLFSQLANIFCSSEVDKIILGPNTTPSKPSGAAANQ